MEQLLLSREDAAKALAISTDTLDRLADGGYLRRLKIGSRTVYDPNSLRLLRDRLRACGQINLHEAIK